MIKTTATDPNKMKPIKLNKNGMEFARVVGEIDFSEKLFVDFLKKNN